MGATSAALVVGLVLLSADPATPAAQDTIDLAKSLFDAGTNAYKAERYETAIGLFERSYKLTQHLPVLYALAQAYRLQYFKDDDPAKLAKSIELYAAYVERAPPSSLREQAAEHMRVLSSLRAKLETSSSPDPKLERLVEEAVRALEDGRHEERVELLRRAAEIQPAPATLDDLAQAFEAVGRYEDASEIYARMIADPGSPRILIKRARERLERLGGKLERAWLQPEAGSSGQVLTIDGKAASLEYTVSGRAEIGLEPGMHVLECETAPNEVALAFVVLRAGTSSIALASESSAFVAWRDPSPPWPALVVDGYEVRAGGSARRIGLPPGRRQITSRFPDRVETRVVELAPSATVELDNLFGAAASGRITAAPRAEPSIAPWIALAGGLAAGAVGGVIYGLAESERSDLERSINRGGAIADVTMREADSRAGRADAQATAGFVLIAAGLGAVGAGAIWWLLE